MEKTVYTTSFIDIFKFMLRNMQRSLAAALRPATVFTSYSLSSRSVVKRSGSERSRHGTWNKQTNSNLTEWLKMNLHLHLQLPKLHHTLHFKEIYVITQSHYKLQYLFSCTVFWPQYMTLRNYWAFRQMFQKYKLSRQIFCWPKEVAEYFLASAHWIMCLIATWNRGHTVALIYFSYIQSLCPEILNLIVPTEHVHLHIFTRGCKQMKFP